MALFSDFHATDCTWPCTTHKLRVLRACTSLTTNNHNSTPVFKRKQLLPGGRQYAKYAKYFRCDFNS
eukprot:597829-Prymnesium_polylepis.2